MCLHRRLKRPHTTITDENTMRLSFAATHEHRSITSTKRDRARSTLYLQLTRSRAESMRSSGPFIIVGGGIDHSHRICIQHACTHIRNNICFARDHRRNQPPPNQIAKSFLWRKFGVPFSQLQFLRSARISDCAKRVRSTIFVLWRCRFGLRCLLESLNVERLCRYTTDTPLSGGGESTDGRRFSNGRLWTIRMMECTNCDQSESCLYAFRAQQHSAMRRATTPQRYTVINMRPFRFKPIDQLGLLKQHTKFRHSKPRAAFTFYLHDRM